MAGIVQFCHGSNASKYLEYYKNNPEVWGNALFFDTTNKVIYKDGEIYGGAGEGAGVMPEQIQEMFIKIEPDANNGKGLDFAYTYSFIDYAGDSNYSITIPVASYEKSGLLLPSEKNKLNSINLDNYVLKEDNKGLSSNDFTQDYIDIIDELLEIAEPNVIETVKVDDIPLTVIDKTVNIKLQEYINTRVGSAYVYKGSVETYSELPNSNIVAGDVYNIVQASDYGPAGTNVAWVLSEDGGYWDSLAGTFDVSNIERNIDNIEANVSTLTTKVDNLEDINAESRISNIENKIDEFLGELPTLTDAVNNISLTNIANALEWELIE